MSSTQEIRCAPWCTDEHGHKMSSNRADQNCWGPDHPVILGLDDHAPAAHLSVEEQLAADPARITPSAYKPWYGLPVVYLHMYRPSENTYLNLDTSLHLTPSEAVELANHLIAVVETIGGGAAERTRETWESVQ